MKLLSKREYFFIASSSIDFFIEQIGTKKDIISIVVKKVTSSLKERTDFETIKKNLVFLNNINIDLNEKENKYIEILIKLNERKEIYEFLFKTSVQECRNLQEILSESDNTFISTNDLLDVERCVEFFQDFGKLKELKKKKMMKL